MVRKRPYKKWQKVYGGKDWSAVSCCYRNQWVYVATER